MAPHATSTKNGSPSATCATTFWAACEASGEMTEAAMRAVVAMAVCFFLFNDNSERGTLVSYEHISSACSLSLSLCLRECLRASRTGKERERRDNQENKNLSASRKERASALSEAHAKDTTRTTLRLALEHIPRDAIIAQNRRSKRATVRARALAHSARSSNPSRNN